MYAGKSRGLWLWSALCLLLSMPTTARITAEVDRTNIAMGETLRLTLTADAGERPDQISLDQLEIDFEILQRSSSTSARLIGGEQNITRTLEIELSPLREGVLTIPAFNTGGRRTTPTAVKVSPEPEYALAEELVTFDATVDNTEVYVQAQVILTITLQQAINLDNRAVSDVDIPDTYQEALEQKSFQRRSGGRLWQVTELRYALFPQKSGDLLVPAIAFSGRELLPGRSLLGARLGRRIAIKSDPINIRVKPVPATFPGDVWLPAQQLSLTSRWSAAPEQLSTGDSTTRTLEITAQGLQGSQLPPVTSLGGTGGIKGLRFYPDKETIEQREIPLGLEGYRLQSEALVSSEAGNWTLPERTIPWWNTKTDTLEFARLPEERIRVTDLLAPKDSANSDIATTPVLTEGTTVSGRLWQISAATGWLLAAILGALLWLRRRDTNANPPHDQADIDAQKTQHLMSVRKACSTNDPVAARLAVLTWGHKRFDDSSPNTLNEIAARVGGDLAEELRAIDTLLFSKDSNPSWQGAKLFKLLKNYDAGTTSKEVTELRLYPTN
ncbi:Forkhead-associated protein [marine gamma proteobacterium HTCC2080]|nr:Forkhead-associated protein [marine gamma proteobacterium HTCC2080]